MGQITGTDSGEVLYGTAGNDTISALGGSDGIYGSSGVDQIDGGADYDWLQFDIGGSSPGLTLTAGNRSFTLGASSVSDSAGEIVTSFSGIEHIYLSSYSNQGFATGDTTIDASGFTGSGGVYVYGYATARLLITGSAQNDTFASGSAADVLEGGGGSDSLYGNGGDDTLRGAEGDDWLNGALGNDLLEGGAGTDWAVFDSYGGSITIDLNQQGVVQLTGVGNDVLVGIENVRIYNPNSNNSVLGDGNANQITTEGANDTLSGGAGNDYIYSATYSGSSDAKNQMLSGGADDDFINFEGGSYYYNFSTGSYSFHGRYVDTVTLNGESGDDFVSVTAAGRAIISGGAGADTVTIDTRGGTYSITLGSERDTLRFASTEGNSLGTSRITVSDFQTGANADYLDLWSWANGGALTNLTGANLFADGHLRLIQMHADTLLQVDRDGGSDNWSTLAVFQNTTTSSFTADNVSWLPATPYNGAPSVEVNSRLTLAEGASATITGTMLDYNDAEQPDSMITYTVTSAPANGVLSKRRPSEAPSNIWDDLAIGGTFTQSDIAGGRIRYSHSGNETTTDAFTVTVSDSAGAQVTGQRFAIDVTPVNDAPSIGNNSGLTVAEGRAGALTAVSLTFNDPEEGAEAITYSLSTPPAQGTLLRDGTAIALEGTFTQAEVNAGRISYRHSGGEASTDSLLLSVSDGKGATVTGQRFAITVTPVNDAPTQALNAGATVRQGASTGITAAMLDFDDVEQADAAIAYTLTALPTHGTLLRNGVVLAPGGSFTQADLAAGLVRYAHGGAGMVDDAFGFSVSDGAGGVVTGRSFAIDVLPPVNRSEVVVNSYTTGDQVDSDVAALVGGGHVVVWQSGGLSGSHQGAQDGSYEGIYLQRFDDAGEKIGGEVQVNTNTLYSQLDPSVTALASGGFVVAWMSNHLGSEYSVAFQRFDANGAKLGAETRVGTTAPGDLEVVSLADGGYAVIWKPSEGGLHVQRFDASGAIAGAEAVITSGPANYASQLQATPLPDGGFALVWTGSLPGESLPVRFLQRFHANGAALGEPHAVTSTADWNLGVGVAGLANGDIIVTWVAATNDTRDVFQQRFDASGAPIGPEMRVMPLLEGAYISTAVATALEDGGHLVVWESRNFDSSSDLYAQRFAADGSRVGKEFQIDVASDRPSYANVVQTASGDVVVTWSEWWHGADASGWAVVSRLMTLPETPVTNTAPIAPADLSHTIYEGERVTLTPAMIGYADAQQASEAIIYTLTALPAHGVLRAGGVPLGVGDSFTLADLNIGRVVFLHNGSEVRADGFRFDVSDGAGGQALDQQVSLTVMPVDDNLSEMVVAGVGAHGAVIAPLAGGGHVVAWTATETTPWGAQLPVERFQLYDVNGYAWGSETSASEAGSLSVSNVVGLGDGSFVVVSTDQFRVVLSHSPLTYRDEYRIHTRHFDADGNPLGDAVQVNAANTINYPLPAVSELADGGFALTWSNGTGIFLRRFNGSGEASGPEMRVDAISGAGQYFSKVIGTHDGGIAVLWHSEVGSSSTAYLQRFDANGTPAGGPSVLAGVVRSGYEAFAAVELSNGDFIVAGEEYRNGSLDIVLRRFDADGVAQGGAPVANLQSAGTQARPALTALSDGGFAVSWSTPDTPGWENTRHHIVLRRFDANGVGEDSETVVAYTNYSEPLGASIVENASGNVVMLWGQPVFDWRGYITGVDVRTRSFSDNTAPTPVDNQGLVAAFGGSTVITGAMLDFDDLEQSDALITYSLVDYPTWGGVTVYGSWVSSFTQAQLEAGAVAYVHDGYSTQPDGFTFTVSDGNGGLVEGQSFAITIGSARRTGTAGADRIELVAPTIDTIVDGLGGRDTLVVDLSGSATPASGQWNGTTGAGSLVRGSVDIDFNNIEVLDIRLGGGDDSFGQTGTGAALIDGGGGTDRFRLDASSATGAITFALAATGTSAFAGTEVSIGNFESVEVSAGLGADRLTGGAANDALSGGDGNDTLSGGAGDDQLDGGGGIDTADYSAAASGVTVSLLASGPQGTGMGSDTLTAIENLTGSVHADALTGNALANRLDGGAGADTMAGGIGDDIYIVDSAGDVVVESAGAGDDLINAAVSFGLAGQHIERLTLTGSANINATGNGFANVLTGNTGNNMLDGSVGSDTMAGGIGNDTYVADSSSDVVTELAGEGTDLVLAWANYTLSADVENLTLTGAAAFNATGNTLGNLITGNGMSNTLTGLDGNDTLDGGAAADWFIGGTGDDTYVIDNTGDVLFEAAGAGTDTVRASISYNLSGQQVENLVLLGTANIAATGNGFANVLTGNSGNNTLDGLVGADTLAGGLGNDSYVVDNAGDVVTENASEGTDTVKAGVTYTLTANVENLVLTGATGISGFGNALANSITGNAANNTLDGGAGNDTLDGGLGDDRYFVDSSTDQIIEANGAGTDTVLSSVAFNLTGQFLENLTLTGNANVNATGNGLVNVLTGNSGNNLLDGQGGADTMAGGLGNDIYVVEVVGDVVQEASGAGIDTVQSWVDYSLAGQFIENLTLLGQLPNTNATGNSLGNVLTGSGGNNVINGGLGDDTMIGGLGNDTYYVDSTFDVVTEYANQGTDTVISQVGYTLSGSHIENLTLTGSISTYANGNGLDNVLVGNSGANSMNARGGNDLLAGGLGADTLTGEAGQDTFRFDTALGGGNVDSITDFAVVDDTIQIDDAIFAGVGTVGTLAGAAFRTGAAAHDLDDRIFYNAATGALFYDADGSNAGAAVQFATLTAGLALTNADFVVI